MLILIKSRSSAQLGLCGSKPRSPGRIFEKRVHSRGYNFDQKFMKICQNVNPHEIKVKCETGLCGSNSRSLGQISEKRYVHPRGHSFDQKFIKTLSEC